MDGVSLAYPFASANAAPQKRVPYLDNNGSCAIHQDGVVAATFGPIIERCSELSTAPIPAGKHRSELTIELQTARPMSAADVLVKVDGQEVARTTVARSLPTAPSASETFGVGVDLGSTVSLDFMEHRPFRFDGKVSVVKMVLNN